MWLAKLKLYWPFTLGVTVLVLGSLAAAMYYRGEAISHEAALDQFKAKQKSLVEARKAEQDVALATNQAKIVVLKNRNTKLLEYMHAVVKDDATQQSELDTERVNTNRLREFIIASFSARRDTGTQTKHTGCADRIPNRDFRKLVIDCTKTTLILKEANQWIDLACDETPGVKCGN